MELSVAFSQCMIAPGTMVTWNIGMMSLVEKPCYSPDSKVVVDYSLSIASAWSDSTLCPLIRMTVHATHGVHLL